MPILFICPDCASTLRVPDNAGGCDTRCPKCYAALIVPDPGERRTDANLLGAWRQTVRSGQPPKLEPSGSSPGFLARLRDASSAAITAFIGGMRSDAESPAVATDDQQGRARRPETEIPTSPFAPVAVQIGRAAAGNSAVAEPISRRGHDPVTNADGTAGNSADPKTISDLKPPETAAVHPPKPLAESADPKKNRPPDLIPDDPLVDLGSWGASHDLEAGAIKRVGNVEVALGYRFSTVYVPHNARGIAEGNMPILHTPFVVGYREPGGVYTLPTAGFIPVNGEPHKIEFASSDASIVKICDDGSASFHRGGIAQVTARIAGNSISISVTVVEFPLNAGRMPKEYRGNAASVEDVVRCLGLPDQRTHHFVASSDPKTIDGIRYCDDIAVDHWTYRKYPGAVIAVVGHSSRGWLWCVGTRKDR